MNILLYLEPHPIRNSFRNFCGVIEHFKRIFEVLPSDNHKIFIYGNTQTIDEIANRYKHLKKNCIYPSEEEQNFFATQYNDWDNGGMKSWISLMSGGEKATEYKELIKNIFYRQHFDYIVHWGTNDAVRQAAKELNVGYVDMELGCCRHPYISTLVADPWGGNGSSVLSQATLSDIEALEDGNSALSDLQEYYSLNRDEGWLQSFGYINDSRLLSLSECGKKIAFIPLQLYDDANLIMYSGYDEVIDVLKDILPKLSSAGYLCLIKEHPASSIRHGSYDANLKAREYAETFDNVVWLDSKYKAFPNAVFFKISDVVITVNSSVGFEALFYDKNVVVLGDAVYKVKGLYPDLAQYFSGNWDRENYLKNIAKLRRFFLEYYLIKDNYFSHPDKFISKIKAVGDLSKRNLTTGEIIQAYVRQS